MELLILLAYVSVCIALFAITGIPLNRISVPLASVGGLLLVFGLVQVLYYYHPYTDSSGQIECSVNRLTQPARRIASWCG